MYVQVQGQGGWSAPYPTCNQVISLCSSVTLVIKQPVPLWQIYMWSLCLCGSGNSRNNLVCILLLDFEILCECLNYVI